jgi:SAM-dependent methyltransferase
MSIEAPRGSEGGLPNRHQRRTSVIPHYGPQLISQPLEAAVLSEVLARAGQVLISDTAPNGKSYWERRFWDRDTAEKHPVLAHEFAKQKETITGYLEKYGADARRAIEFACGTGEFTRLTMAHTSVEELTAIDISAQGLAIARARVPQDNVQFLQGDFWAAHDGEPADLVLCIDAIHHLGRIGDVVQHIKKYVKPGGIFIGNLFTGDNFHEFERKRYGAAEHLWRTTLFFGTAVMIRASGGRLYSRSHRTQLIPSQTSEAMIASVFPEILEVSRDPYFTAFVCRA